LVWGGSGAGPGAGLLLLRPPQCPDVSQFPPPRKTSTRGNRANDHLGLNLLNSMTPQAPADAQGLGEVVPPVYRRKPFATSTIQSTRPATYARHVGNPA